MATQARKTDHVKICLSKDVEYGKSTGFEKWDFVHNALPEMNLDDVDMSAKFLGKDFNAPLFVEAMTGGVAETAKINSNLARAAEELGIGMGVGSQRAAIENPKLAYTYQVRKEAPTIFLLGNLGAAQILEYSIDDVKKAVDMIKADGLAIHLNPAHEAAQPEGSRDWKDVLDGIKDLCSSVKFPVVVKETGCGISGEAARKLESAGVKAIDVAGAGGTSWIKVESYRGSNVKSLSEWGIPTAEALKQCTEAVRIPLIASGGIRTGLDCAKALSMGASLAGMALPLLKPATVSAGKVKEVLEQIVDELRAVMFLTGAETIKDLRKAELVKV